MQAGGGDHFPPKHVMDSGPTIPKPSLHMYVISLPYW